jgi:hypothetical protein
MDLTPRRTGRLTVGRKVTLTLTLTQARCPRPVNTYISSSAVSRLRPQAARCLRNQPPTNNIKKLRITQVVYLQSVSIKAHTIHNRVLIVGGIHPHNCQPYSPAALHSLGRFLVLISVRGCVRTRDMVWLEESSKLKKCSALMGNRNRYSSPFRILLRCRAPELK